MKQLVLFLLMLLCSICTLLAQPNDLVRLSDETRDSLSAKGWELYYAREGLAFNEFFVTDDHTFLFEGGPFGGEWFVTVLDTASLIKKRYRINKKYLFLSRHPSFRKEGSKVVFGPIEFQEWFYKEQKGSNGKRLYFSVENQLLKGISNIYSHQFEIGKNYLGYATYIYTEKNTGAGFGGVLLKKGVGNNSDTLWHTTINQKVSHFFSGPALIFLVKTQGHLLGLDVVREEVLVWNANLEKVLQVPVHKLIEGEGPKLGVINFMGVDQPASLRTRINVDYATGALWITNFYDKQLFRLTYDPASNSANLESMGTLAYRPWQVHRGWAYILGSAYFKDGTQNQIYRVKLEGK